MKRNFIIFLSTFLILGFLFASLAAAVFIFFDGTSLRDCFDLTVGKYAERLSDTPTLGERIDADTAESISAAADFVADTLPFRKRVIFQTLLTGVFFLKF